MAFAQLIRKQLPQRKVAVSLLFSRHIHNTSWLYSGHSKWATIKHDKAKNDAERNKITNRMSQQITLAVKLGGSPDPSLNIRLQSAIEQAYKNNVTKRLIENAIKKGSGVSSSTEGEQLTYEGIGPGGVAFIVEAFTDNKNRTVAMVKSAFNKSDGNFSPSAYFFDRKGFIEIQPLKTDKDDFDVIMEKLLTEFEEGIEDLEELDSIPITSANAQEQAEEIHSNKVLEIICDPTVTNTLAKEIKEKLNYKIKKVSNGYKAKEDMMVVPQEEHMKKLNKLYTALDEIDDVSDFYTNAKE